MIILFDNCWDALGCLEPSPKILDAIVEIGDGFVLTELEFDPMSHYYEFFTRGICFGFDNKLLNHIMFYVVESGQYAKCDQNVVTNVTNRTTIEDLFNLFGSPTKSGEKTNISWVKYRIDLRKSIHFEFEMGVMQKISFLYEPMAGRVC